MPRSLGLNGPLGLSGGPLGLSGPLWLARAGGMPRALELPRPLGAGPGELPRRLELPCPLALPRRRVLSWRCVLAGSLVLPGLRAWIPAGR